MNHQIEAPTIPQSNSREMAHVACRQTTDAESLGEGHDTTVYEAETEIGVAPINLHRA